MQPAFRSVEISLKRVAECPFSVAQEYAEDYLTMLAAGGGLRFAARADLTDRGKPHDELSVWWRSGSHILGDVEITIRFRIAALATRYVLHASCHPGEAGEFGDDAVARVLRAAADDFLEHMAHDAEQRERRYRAEHPPALGPVRRPAAVPA